MFDSRRKGRTRGGPQVGANPDTSGVSAPGLGTGSDQYALHIYRQFIALSEGENRFDLGFFREGIATDRPILLMPREASPRRPQYAGAAEFSAARPL